MYRGSFGTEKAVPYNKEWCQVCGGVCTPKVGAAYCFTAAEKTVSDPHLVFERPAQECVRVPPSSCFSSTKFHTRVLEMKARHLLDDLHGTLFEHLHYTLNNLDNGDFLGDDTVHIANDRDLLDHLHAALDNFVYWNLTQNFHNALHVLVNVHLLDMLLEHLAIEVDLLVDNLLSPDQTQSHVFTNVAFPATSVDSLGACACAI